MRGVSSRGRPLFGRGAATTSARGTASASTGSLSASTRADSASMGAATASRPPRGGRGGRGTRRIGGRGRRSGSASTDSAQEAPLPEEAGVDVEGDEGPLWMRGPANLPPRPRREEDKPILVPVGDIQWREQGGAESSRLPNGILGVLVRMHFPGLVTFKGKEEPPWTWEHYQAKEDAPDENGIQYANCLERVEESFWDWFRCEEGEEEHAREVVRKVVKKLIPQMYYEARIQAVTFYTTQVLKRDIKRAEACQTRLSIDAYMEAIPWWAATHEDAWRQIVETRWCNEEYQQKGREARQRRLLMRGPSHRQGSSSMARYKKHMENKEQRPVSDVEAFVAARRGNSDSALCNRRAMENLESYSDAAKAIHGQDFDVMHEPIDPVAVYKAGRGKKHGRYMMADGYINSQATQSAVRASSSGSSAEVPPQRRPRTSNDLILELQAKLEEETAARKKMEAIIMSIQATMNATTPNRAAVTPLSTAGSAGSNTPHTASDGHGGDGSSSPPNPHITSPTP